MKIFYKLLIMIIFLLCITFNVSAQETTRVKPTVVFDHSILRSDGSLWKIKAGKYYKATDNVAKLNPSCGGTIAIKRDGTLWYDGYGDIMSNVQYAKTISTKSYALDEVIALKTDSSLWMYSTAGNYAHSFEITTNVRSFDSGKCIFGFVTNNDELWIAETKPFSTSYSKSSDFTFKHLTDDVKDISIADNYLLLRKNDDSLYLWSEEHGIKKLFDNVISYSITCEDLSSGDTILVICSDGTCWYGEDLYLYNFFSNDFKFEVVGYNGKESYDGNTFLTNSNSVYIVSSNNIANNICNNVSAVCKHERIFSFVSFDGYSYLPGYYGAQIANDFHIPREVEYDLNKKANSSDYEEEYGLYKRHGVIYSRGLPVSAFGIQGKETINVTESHKYTAIYYDKNGNEVNDPNVSWYYDQNGVIEATTAGNIMTVKALAPGIARISAYHNPTGEVAEFYIEVIEKPIYVELDGLSVTFDQMPVIKDDRVMVPLRKIFEELGYTVDWNGNTQTATAKRGDDYIIVQIGNHNILYRLGITTGTFTNDVAPFIAGERTLVPVRAIAQCAGCNVKWDAETYTVFLYSKKYYKTIAADMPESNLLETKGMSIVNWNPMVGMTKTMMAAPDDYKPSDSGVAASFDAVSFIDSFVRNSVEITTLRADIGKDGTVSVQYGQPLELFKAGKRTTLSLLINEAFYNMSPTIVFTCDEEADKRIREWYNLDGEGKYSMEIYFGGVAPSDYGYYLSITSNGIYQHVKFHPDTYFKVFYKENGEVKFLFDAVELEKNTVYKLSDEEADKVLKKLNENGIYF